MARTRPGLTREAILVAALGIIDESGIEACTMRAVAANLGVEAMSLYWHVPSKEALLDGVVELMLGEVAAERFDVPVGWRARMEAFGHAYHAILLRHPNALHLIAGRPFGAYVAASRMAEVGLPTLVEAGFDRRSAIRAIRTVTRFVLGFTLLEVSSARNPPAVPDPSSPLANIMDAVADEEPAELFGFGLVALVNGFEAHLGRA